MPLIRARSFGSSSRTEKSSLSPEARPKSFGLANVDSSSSSTTAIFLRPSSLDTIPPPVAVAGALSFVSCPEGGFGFGFALDSPLFSRSVSSEWRMISLNALRSSGGASLPLSATSMASSSDAARSRRSRRRASMAASSDASACPSLSFVEERDEDDDSLSFVSSSASLAADLTCSSANTATADSMSDLSDAADAASSSSSSTTSISVSSSPASIRAMAWTAR